MAQIFNKYYVGEGQPYGSVTQALNTIADILGSGDFTLPSSTLPDGGNVNIVIRGGGLHRPFRIADNTTGPLAANGRYLVITREEFTESGVLVSDSLPVISSAAPMAADLEVQDRVIACNIGDNNPNVKLIGIRVQDSVIGVNAGFNCHDLEINRCFITNCSNAQIYVHDSHQVAFVNNILVGGEFGLVAKFCRGIKAIHNTIFLDGLTALNGEAKAGMVLQGDRLFGAGVNNFVTCLGNLIYTIGGVGAIFYKEDLDLLRINSDYNDFFNVGGTLVELRQDNAQLAGEDEIIDRKFFTLADWQGVGTLPLAPGSIDNHSISVHPVFIQNISIAGSTPTSVIDLTQIGNSPILGRVPSWFFVNDPNYIPSDFDTDLISKDSLLNAREKPFTAIGANDGPSVNGFFGQDIFTSPLLTDPERSCDLDPLAVISAQNLDMVYPAIMAGYFWSHERPYYLYGKKGASQLGFLARTTFDLPAHVDVRSNVVIKFRDRELPEDSWDLVGKQLKVWHKDVGIVSYEDEIQVECEITSWNENGFSSRPAYYIFRIKDGKTDFVLPPTYQPGAPVVVTDDRVNLLDPIDVTRREFKVEFDEDRQETTLNFLPSENLVSNAAFNITSTYKTPSYWNTDPVGDDKKVFLVGANYSYMGDLAVGIKVNEDPGWIASNRIPIERDTHTTLSWHSRIPVDMSGFTGGNPVTTGDPIEFITGHYYVHFYDQFNQLIEDSPEGDFFATRTGFYRHYLTVGSSDIDINEDIQGVDSAPLDQVSNLISFPDTATHLELVLSGTANADINPDAFMVVDAVQIENTSEPTYFHPELSFDAMTVEYETDPSGIFVDKRMNITPFFNENPNGFLYITDMPADLWGGPSDVEVTTLNEYRWPVGRISVLPWSRLHGKDKLKQVTFESEAVTPPTDIIAPYVLPKKASEAAMTPAVLTTVQGQREAEGLNIRVIDNARNSYGLRRYTLQVYDPNDNFPGWLAKRKFGAKEQLGNSIFGQLNSNGSVSAHFVPPDSDLIRVVDVVPTPINHPEALSGTTDRISIVETPYNVNLDNNGNITIIGEGGKFHSTQDVSFTTGMYHAEVDTDSVKINLEHPPVFGSLSISQDETTFAETQGNPQQDEFFVNYPFAQVVFPAGTPATEPFNVSFQPKYAYPDPNDQRSIIIHHDQVFSEYDGPIQVDYDAEIFVEIRVQQTVAGEFVGTFPIVLQNPKLSVLSDDPASLEF